LVGHWVKARRRKAGQVGAVSEKSVCGFRGKPVLRPARARRIIIRRVSFDVAQFFDVRHPGTRPRWARVSCIGIVNVVPSYVSWVGFTIAWQSRIVILQGSSWRLIMGRKRQWPSPRVPERNRQFARHLNRLLSDASLDPAGLAALLGRTEILIYKYLQGVHLPRLNDLPEIAQALKLQSCRDLIPTEWCDPSSLKKHNRVDPVL
jgi:hypothetical protein